jgi:hypothetical protein
MTLVFLSTYWKEKEKFKLTMHPHPLVCGSGEVYNVDVLI